jgi:pimeloyl-ACP methyl ester carboxylesterase
VERPGPAPRTFDQINLELHDAMAKLGEHGPFVLVGHSFGGPIVRNFARLYPDQVAGIVFLDAVSEDQRFEMWHKAVLMRDGAKGNHSDLNHHHCKTANTGWTEDAPANAQQPIGRCDDWN